MSDAPRPIAEAVRAETAFLRSRIPALFNGPTWRADALDLTDALDRIDGAVAAAPQRPGNDGGTRMVRVFIGIDETGRAFATAAEVTEHLRTQALADVFALESLRYDCAGLHRRVYVAEVPVDAPQIDGADQAAARTILHSDDVDVAAVLRLAALALGPAFDTKPDTAAYARTKALTGVRALIDALTDRPMCELCGEDGISSQTPTGQFVTECAQRLAERADIEMAEAQPQP